MPTYEYECEACGHHFDHFQSMSSRRLRTCPECKKKKLIRLVGAGAGVIFKGSGFYETDYKRASSPKDESSKSGDGKSDGGDAKNTKADSSKKSSDASKGTSSKSASSKKKDD